jgi:hypothetical protein
LSFPFVGVMLVHDRPPVASLFSQTQLTPEVYLFLLPSFLNFGMLHVFV